jgi:hypothetical protein
MANPYLAAGQAIKGGIDAAGDAAKGAAEDSTGEGA